MTDPPDRHRRRVLITGSSQGQLYSELVATLPADFSLCRPARRIDITNRSSVGQAIAHYRPQLIINAAAYTAVDLAESEPAEAEAVNAHGPAHLAEAARGVAARLLHVSTDFVFGQGHNQPIDPAAVPHPESVYGRTKLAGETAVLNSLPGQALVVRTAWVYSVYGHNFVKTMLRLMSERTELGVVADQTGSPTWAKRLAEALWRAARAEHTGILHMAGLGTASWYDVAVAIAEEGSAVGLLGRPEEPAPAIRPIATQDYPTPAVRPCYSVLDSRESVQMLGLPTRHWREDLRLMLRELACGD